MNDNTQNNTTNTAKKQNDDLGGATLNAGQQGEVAVDTGALDLNVLVEQKTNLQETAEFKDEEPVAANGAVPQNTGATNVQDDNKTQTLNDLENLNNQDIQSEENAKKVEEEMNNVDDLKSLSDAGVTVVDDIKPTESVSQETESSKEALDDLGEKAEITTPEPVATPEPTPTKSIKDVKKSDLTKNPTIQTEDLEQEFSTTLNFQDEKAKLGGTGLGSEVSALQKILNKIKDKISFKKVDVRGRIDILRKEKEVIGQELEDIKELEETEHKIEEKIQSLKKIDEELDMLEKEAEEELS